LQGCTSKTDKVKEEKVANEKEEVVKCIFQSDVIYDFEMIRLNALK